MTPHAIADLLDCRSPDDDVAAEAYELFGRCVFPFEGVFVRPETFAEGALSDLLRQDSLPVTLLYWAPAFCCAVRDLDRPLGEQVVLALDTLLSGIDGEQAEPPALVGRCLDPDDPETDLRELVDWLSTPCRCGFFLSTAVIEDIGRGVSVPRGFGNRRRLLRELIVGASRYDRLQDVLARVAELAEKHRERLDGYGELSPSLSGATVPWRERLEETRRQVARVSDLVRTSDRL